MRSRDEIKEFLKVMRNMDMNMIDRAIAFAEFAHAGQLDKAGQAYIQHPCRVGENTAKRYCDENLTAAAYMHDVVEDGNFTITDLSAFFPKVVWATVELLTRKKAEDRSVYINDIGKNLLAIKVKLIDLDDNMNLNRLPYVTEKDYERQSRYIDEYRYLNECLYKFEEKLTKDEMDSNTYADLYM
ncbi:MAG: HD domain-containing protein [Fibrobacter sp.]|nr:HD domain-containing protein [Fibrobacter sp.]